MQSSNENEFLFNSKHDHNLFAIDSGDFGGKTSVCEVLKTDFTIKRLPGATKTGEDIRSILKNGYSKHVETEYYLLCAADAEFFCKERLQIKEKILLDRSWVSRVIYQSQIGGISLERVFTDLAHSWNKTLPYKTVILTCSAEELKRRMTGRKNDNWFDSRAEEVRQLYLNFCKEYPQYVHEISTDNLKPYEVAAKAKEYFLS